jgi:acyl-coenzyme A synthetase/AMP-(fatty) acid ligase
MPEVMQVTVFGEKNALLGQIVKAQVQLNVPMTLSDFRIQMRIHCERRLEPCKIPQDVQIIDSAILSGEGKKRRDPGLSPF